MLSLKQRPFGKEALKLAVSITGEREVPRIPTIEQKYSNGSINTEGIPETLREDGYTISYTTPTRRSKIDGIEEYHRFFLNETTNSVQGVKIRAPKDEFSEPSYWRYPFNNGTTYTLLEVVAPMSKRAHINTKLVIYEPIPDGIIPASQPKGRRRLRPR